MLSGDGLMDANPGPVEPNGVVIRMLGIDNHVDPHDADGDGKLGLADVPTKSAMDGEPISLTFGDKDVGLLAGRIAQAVPTPSITTSTVWDDTDIVHVFAESLSDGGVPVNREVVPPRWDDTDVVHAFAEPLPDDLYVETAELAGFQDGKLRLDAVQVKTAAAPEPTSLTFNGRGIDLNEDDKIDSLSSEPAIGGGISLINGEFDFAGQSAPGGGYWIVINRDTGVVDDAPADGKITPQEHTNLRTVIAYEPVWAIGTVSTDCGPPVKGSGSTNNVSSPDVDPSELPIVMDVLGSTKDFEMSTGQNEVLSVAAE